MIESIPLALAILSAFHLLCATAASTNSTAACDTIEHGYNCDPAKSHFWGQYSPYFSVGSNISTEVPPTCEISFVQILSRHGARFPTTGPGADYNATVSTIQANVHHYPESYKFLQNYVYSLGTENLTTFGQMEMYDSGVKAYDRYKEIARTNIPFIRASGEYRVVESALNFTSGFNSAKQADPKAPHAPSDFPYLNLIIPEAAGVNNSLDPQTCANFDDPPDSTINTYAEATWADIFVPPIQNRINKHLVGANLTVPQVIYLMELCPFNTVANIDADESPFCSLFSHEEWQQYNYHQTLDEYYANGHGNPLGPSQGVGFVNELIARMTGRPVHDRTSVNQTLDSSKATFPYGRHFYADFTHDSAMVSMFSAFGLYNGTQMLPNTTAVEAPMADGFSAAWVVPFAARAYFEKMTCNGEKEEMVRVIINDRVLPLPQCGGDEWGLCTLSRFVKSLSFARNGGLWSQCFN